MSKYFLYGVKERVFALFPRAATSFTDLRRSEYLNLFNNKIFNYFVVKP